MPIDDAFRKCGFRRWYERQLVESHAYLVTGVLSLIMMAIALETIEFRASPVNAMMLVAIAGSGGVLCIHAWNRFSALLSRAEALAEQAVCRGCTSYGRFEVVSAHDSKEALTGRLLTVRCRKCAHEWTMG